jgi:hypothetical protein
VEIPATSDNIPGTLVLRDNTGGFDLKPASIVDADVSATAAIAGTKISPNFGSQNVTTTGSLVLNGSLATTVKHINGGSVSAGTSFRSAGQGVIALANEGGTNASAATSLAFVRGRGALGAPDVVQSGDWLGGITFQGNDGTAPVIAARITAEVDGTPGTNNMPGRLVFSTTPSGSATPTERMRINSSGDLLAQTTTPVDVTTGTADGFTVLGNGQTHLSRNNSIPLFLRRRSANGQVAQLRRDTTEVGSISVTTTAAAFNTSSDYRLKQNVEPMVGGLAKLAALAPKTFEFKSEPGVKVDGFIAHEVQEVVPIAVNGEKDGEEMQGLDHSKLVPVLVAAVQELSAKVAALEAALQTK